MYCHRRSMTNICSFIAACVVQTMSFAVSHRLSVSIVWLMLKFNVSKKALCQKNKCFYCVVVFAQMLKLKPFWCVCKIHFGTTRVHTLFLFLSSFFSHFLILFCKIVLYLVWALVSGNNLSSVVNCKALLLHCLSFGSYRTDRFQMSADAGAPSTGTNLHLLDVVGYYNNTKHFSRSGGLEW